jgi:PBP1b-binding outer membrane lipoprotein LpoB
MTKIIPSLTLSLAALLIVGCAPKNEGIEHGTRVERRAGDGYGLASADLTQATDQAVAGIANVPGIRRADGRTVIVMDQVENRTSDASADFQIFLARIRASLNNSGATKALVFVETRHKSEQIKAREGYPAKATARTLPTYALTASFYDLPRGAKNYYLLTFQLVDLTNDLIAWEGSYEVKL